MLTCLVPVLFTSYIQDVLKLKNNSGAKGLMFIRFVIPFVFNKLMPTRVHLIPHIPTVHSQY